MEVLTNHYDWSDLLENWQFVPFSSILEILVKYSIDKNKLELGHFYTEFDKCIFKFWIYISWILNEIQKYWHLVQFYNIDTPKLNWLLCSSASQYTLNWRNNISIKSKNIYIVFNILHFVMSSSTYANWSITALII